MTSLFASALNNPDVIRVAVFVLGMIALVTAVSLFTGRFLSLSSSEPTSILAQVTAEYENFPLFDGWTSTLSIGRSKYTTPVIILALHRYESNNENEGDTIIERVCACPGCLEAAGGDLVELYRDTANVMVEKVKARQATIDSYRRVWTDGEISPSIVN